MYKVIFWISAIGVIGTDIYIYKNMGLETADLITTYALSIAILGIFVTFYQLKANHEWNRRHVAMIEADRSRDKYTAAVKELNSSLDYREREDSYSLKEIHGFICENDDHTKNPDLTEDGKAIKHNIFVILNYYEYLAVGIKNKVFDEKTIKQLLKGALIKANKLFGEYAQHVRDKHNKKNKKQFIEMKKLAEKWEKGAWYKRLWEFLSSRGTAD